MKRLIWRMVSLNLVGFLVIALLFGWNLFHQKVIGGITSPEVFKVSIPWLIGYTVSLFFVTLLSAWRGKHIVLAPLRFLNHELEQIGSHSLDRRVSMDATETEMQSLQEHINNLLSGTNLALIQLKQYAAHVAHELRAPLTLIRLKIEQVADKIDPMLGEEIQRELLRLNLHVEQALFIARAEQGHLTLNRTRFDLACLLQDVVEDFRLLVEEEGRTVSSRVATVYVDADSKYVRQILYSLLTNALRHGRGPILIRLLRSGTLLIANHSSPPNVATDLGIGRRIVSALVGLHGDIRLRSRRLRNVYGVQLSFLVSV